MVSSTHQSRREPKPDSFLRFSRHKPIDTTPILPHQPCSSISSQAVFKIIHNQFYQRRMLRIRVHHEGSVTEVQQGPLQLPHELRFNNITGWIITLAFYGWLPLFLAARQGNTQMVQDSLRQIDFNRPGGSLILGHALRIAAACHKLEMVCLLSRHGANIDEKGPGGMTALHWAAAKGDNHVVARLLLCGANFREKDDKGKLPYKRAWSRGFFQLALCLKTLQADPRKWKEIVLAILKYDNEFRSEEVTARITPPTFAYKVAMIDDGGVHEDSKCIDAFLPGAAAMRRLVFGP